MFNSLSRDAIFYFITFQSIFIGIMKNNKSNKLWKDVGIIQQKYQKTFQRPPSFDKSDLAKSSEADNSHHNTSNHKNKSRVKTQSPTKNDHSIDSPFKLTSQIDGCLKSVPQQDDLFGSVMTFRKAKSKQQQKILNSTEMEIFDQIFKKKQDKKQYKTAKTHKTRIFRTKIQQLCEFQYQFEKDIKFCLSQYRNQLRKHDRKVKEALLRFTKEIFEKNNQIAHLKSQNNDLRAQILQSYEFIEELQKMNSKTINAEKSRIDQELTKKTFEKSIRLTSQNSKSPYLTIPAQTQQTIQRSRAQPSKSLLRRLYSLTQTRPAQSIQKVIRIEQVEDSVSISSQAKKFGSNSIRKRSPIKQNQLEEISQSSKLLYSKRMMQGSPKYNDQQLKETDKRQKFKKFIAERQNKRNQIKTKMNKAKHIGKNQENEDIKQINMFRQSNLSRLSIPLIMKKESINSNPELAQQTIRKNNDLAQTMTVQQRKKLSNNSHYGIFKKARY